MRTACLIVLISVLGAGCMPTLSTLHRMEPALQGESAFATGAGAAYAFDPGGTTAPMLRPTLDLGMRQGLAPDLDIGGRLWPLAFTGSLDLKYRFLRGPVEAAIIPGLGVTIPSFVRGLPVSSNHPFQVQAYGILLLGMGPEGSKLLAAPKIQAYWDSSGVSVLPGAMIGYDIGLGERGNLVPEINFHCATSGGGCLFVASIGMFY